MCNVFYYSRTCKGTCAHARLCARARTRHLGIWVGML